MTLTALAALVPLPALPGRGRRTPARPARTRLRPAARRTAHRRRLRARRARRRPAGHRAAHRRRPPADRHRLRTDRPAAAPGRLLGPDRPAGRPGRHLRADLLVSYLRDDPRYPSYAALVSLFTAAMLLVVYSGDLMVLLVGWEVMGICSYFLVGHYWETEAARSASIKAFLVTKLGDVPFLIGVFALASDAGTFRISGILAAAHAGRLHHPTVIALLLLAGVAGKSAQFPLHTWLPDAMAGPTPVSALIHAATMVAAGIYLVARLLPVFTASAAALAVLAAMAAVTMVGSAPGRARPGRHQTRARLLHDRPARLHGRRAGRRRPRRRRLPPPVARRLQGAALPRRGRRHPRGRHQLADRDVPDGRPGASACPTRCGRWASRWLALAALPPLSGFFSKESVLRAAEHASSGDTAHVPPAVGWTVLVAGLAHRRCSPPPTPPGCSCWPSAARAPQAPDHGRQPVADDRRAVGARRPHHRLRRALPQAARLVRRRRPLAPTLVTSVLGTGLALVGVLITYGAWRRATASRAAGASPHRAPSVAATRRRGRRPAARAEAEAMDTHAGRPTAHRGRRRRPRATPAGCCSARCTAPPADGFHLDAVYAALFVRPVLAAAALVRFLDRDVVETCVRGAGGAPSCSARPSAAPRPATSRPTSSALLAGCGRPRRPRRRRSAEPTP